MEVEPVLSFLGEGANDLQIPLASWIPVQALFIWWVSGLWPCLSLISSSYYVTPLVMIVVLALCTNSSLTFTILPTSFPHSPPFMQSSFILSLLPLTCAIPLHGFWCWPGLFLILLMGHLPLFFCVPGSTAQIQSLEFISGLLTWLTLISECCFHGSTQDTIFLMFNSQFH